MTLYPYAMSMIAVSMVWLLLLDPTNGYINKLLTLLHLPRRMWLFDTSLALGCLIAISVWKDSGYCMLVLLAGMQAIDTALYDAARVDGANAFGQMRHVTLPGLKPVLLFVSVNSCIAAFKTFEQVQTMTGGDPLYSTTTIVHQIYQRGVWGIQNGLCRLHVGGAAHHAADCYSAQLPSVWNGGIKWNGYSKYLRG